jgi:hypothetical protein
LAAITCDSAVTIAILRPASATEALAVGALAIGAVGGDGASAIWAELVASVGASAGERVTWLSIVRALTAWAAVEGNGALTVAVEAPAAKEKSEIM